MFLESITAQGFNGIKSPLTRKFDFQENVNKTITEIEDPNLILAFSIIFDPNIRRNKLAELVDTKSANPFVEIVLWQDETLDEFNWLKANRLKLHRSLREKPDKITVNGKVTDIRSFHRGMASHGYISIDNFHVHRLLSNEISQIEHFSGDDLWNLISKVNDCGDLIQVIETRHRNRKTMNKELAAMMKTMEDVLPSKLKLRNDIKSHIQLSRQFNSLMTIVNRRKAKLLIRNREALMPEMEQLSGELKETATALFEEQVKEALSKNEIKYHQKLQDMILNEQMNLHCMVNEPRDDLQEPLMEAQQGFAANVTSAITILDQVQELFVTVGDFTASQLSKSFAQLDAVKLKLRLKGLKSDGNLEGMRYMWDSKQISTEKSLRACKTQFDKLTTEIVKSKALALKPLEFSQNQFKENLKSLKSNISNFRRMIAKVNMEIYANEKELLDCQFNIEELVLKGPLDMTYVKTLQGIEKFIHSLDAKLSAEYLGPVFQHLSTSHEPDKLDELADKIWPHIESKAKIFLFLRGSTARAVNRKLIESGSVTGSYTFLGLDEFVSVNLTEIEDELKDQVKSAALLVKRDVRFAKILRKLLGDVVLAENKEISRQLPSDRVAVTISSAGITSKSIGCYSITSVPQKLPELAEFTAIDFLQNIYAIIKQQLILWRKIETAKMSREKLEASLKTALKRVENAGTEECKMVNEAVTALRELANLQRSLNKVQTRLQKEEALSLEMKGFEDEDPSTWDEVEMEEAIKALEERFLKEETQLNQMTEDDLCLTDTKLDGVLFEVEISQRKLIATLVNFFTSQDFCQKTKEVNDLIQAQLDKDLKTSEVELRKILQNESAPPFEDTELRLKLNDIRCQLYSKNSEMFVIESALSLCKDTSEVIDQSFYNDFKRQSGEKIAAELAEIRRGLKQHGKSVQLEEVNLEKYGHLFETIKKVKNYSEAPPRMMTRSKVTAKAFPLANQLIVQILKDVVYNFEISFNYLLADFNQKSSLYFYTVGMFEAIKKDDLSWECFDIQRLKAMDFSTDWKDEKVAPKSLKRLKALLLILHIISSMSIFKFVIIEEKFFDGMEETLEKNIRKFLDTISAFVQVILFKNPQPEIDVMEWESAEETL